MTLLPTAGVQGCLIDLCAEAPCALRRGECRPVRVVTTPVPPLRVNPEEVPARVPERVNSSFAPGDPYGPLTACHFPSAHASGVRLWLAGARFARGSRGVAEPPSLAIIAAKRAVRYRENLPPALASPSSRREISS